MKQGTIWLLSFSVLLCIIFVVFAFALKPTNMVLFVVGIALLIGGVGLSMPDILRARKAKQYEKDVRSGKIKPTVTKSYVPNRAKTAEEKAAEENKENN